MSGTRLKRMTVPDLVAAGLAFAAAAWAVIESGRWPAPEFIGGPAVVPRVIAVVLFVAAAVLGWNALKGRSEVIEEPLDGAKKQRLGLMLVVTGAYAAALEPFGFLPATMVYLAVFALVLGMRRWPTIAGYAVGLPAAFHLVFSTVLKVPLPPAAWPF